MFEPYQLQLLQVRKRLGKFHLLQGIPVKPQHTTLLETLEVERGNQVARDVEVGQLRRTPLALPEFPDAVVA